jgi:preprotein translocase subunit YajC
MQRGWAGVFLAQAGKGGGEGQQQQGEGQAQGQGQGQGQPPPAAKRGVDPCPPSMFIPLGLVILLFYLIVLRPQRRQEHQRRELLGALKKNDRVVTVGGIHGVVTNVNPNRDEVTIRVDDDTNTKLRVTRGSIQRVIGPEGSEGDKGNG